MREVPLPAKDAGDRWFEDFSPGAVCEFGEIAVSADKIGGLIASGWHTASLKMRLLVAHFLPPQASLAPPGIGTKR
jgi:hypothetical protein